MCDLNDSVRHGIVHLTYLQEAASVFQSEKQDVSLHLSTTSNQVRTFHSYHPKGACLVNQGSKFIFGFGSNCATRCKFLGVLPKF